MMVAYSPPDGSGRQFVGRLVALPRDSIEVVERRLVVNGEPERPYQTRRSLYATQAELQALTNISDGIAPLRVADGCVFILGDNRADSFDSRHFGCVPKSNVFASIDWWVLKLDPDGSFAWTSAGQDVQPAP